MTDLNTFVYEHTGTGGIVALVFISLLTMWAIYDVWYEMTPFMREHKDELRRNTRLCVHLTFLLAVLAAGNIIAERVMFLVKL